MASQRKAVIVRKFSREWSLGYATASVDAGLDELEILDPGGKVLRFAWDSVKWLCFVRDLAMGNVDAEGPERLVRRRFASRPRTPGLWIRLTLRDGDELEGLSANDRSLIDGSGLMLTPPDTRSNTQRVFVPRSAIQSFEILALIGAPSLRHAAASSEQPGLFADKPEAL